MMGLSPSTFPLNTLPHASNMYLNLPALFELNSADRIKRIIKFFNLGFLFLTSALPFLPHSFVRSCLHNGNLILYRIASIRNANVKAMQVLTAAMSFPVVQSIRRYAKAPANAQVA